MIFTEIQEAHSKLTGWCSWEKAQTLASLVLATRPTLTIEIGTWAGRSFIPMAMAHKHIGYGMAWAIDPWTPKASIAGQTNPADVEWWGHQDKHDYALNQFNKTIIELGLQNVTKVIQSASDDVEPPDDVGLIHLDGNHGEQSIRDTRRFAPKVIVGGFIVFDDLEWNGGAVMNAVQLAIAMGFKELFRCKDSELQNTWAVYQKVR